jgi:hypothetical protein
MKPVNLLILLLVVALTSIALSPVAFAQKKSRGASPDCSQAVEVVKVNTDDLWNLPQGQSYLVDLTLAGVVYTIKAEAQLVDTHIVVRSSSGSQTTLRDWLAHNTLDTSECHLMLAHDTLDASECHLMLAGDPAVLAAARGVEAPAPPSATEQVSQNLRATIGGSVSIVDHSCSVSIVNYKCGSGYCSCRGDVDCNNMFGSGDCDGAVDAYCDDTSYPPTCYCILNRPVSSLGDLSHG